ncbi:MAG: hypothetical protein ACREV6_21770 [Clostridium sp.]|uniref:hypothetical protein n=1 Tax=Clostridium sp. TaxID=1506 RepID=UPI003D6C8FCA
MIIINTSVLNLTGISLKRVQGYAKENNPFNILEHPKIIEPNEKQLQKIGILNKFIDSYNLNNRYIQTLHVECCSLLTRKNRGAIIKKDSKNFVIRFCYFLYQSSNREGRVPV